MKAKKVKKISQKQRILNVLKARRSVSLLTILAMWIANYRMRITELRREGYLIKNYTATVNGKKMSFYRLVSHGDGDSKVAYAFKKY